MGDMARSRSPVPGPVFGSGLKTSLPPTCVSVFALFFQLLLLFLKSSTAKILNRLILMLNLYICYMNPSSVQGTKQFEAEVSKN